MLSNKVKILELSSPFFQNDCWVYVSTAGVGCTGVDDHRPRLFNIRHIKGRHRTRAPHVIADQLLQGGGVDNVEAHAASKGARFPVFRGADGVSHQALEGERSSHLDHGLPKDRISPGLLHQQTRVELHSVNVSVHLLKHSCHFFLS